MSNSLGKTKTDDDDVFYLFLQKQKIALRHIPFGYSPPRNKECIITCDDAATMTLVVQLESLWRETRIGDVSPWEDVADEAQRLLDI
jgi:hypothetical protein